MLTHILILVRAGITVLITDVPLRKKFTHLQQIISNGISSRRTIENTKNSIMYDEYNGIIIIIDCIALTIIACDDALHAIAIWPRQRTSFRSF